MNSSLPGKLLETWCLYKKKKKTYWSEKILLSYTDITPYLRTYFWLREAAKNGLATKKNKKNTVYF